jgi:hypothetical protein
MNGGEMLTADPVVGVASTPLNDDSSTAGTTQEIRKSDRSIDRAKPGCPLRRKDVDSGVVARFTRYWVHSRTPSIPDWKAVATSKHWCKRTLRRLLLLRQQIWR